MSLKKLDFLNREQLQVIHKLGQKRNANRILKELSPYLSSFREEYSTIYYLSALGREYVDSKKVRRKNQFVNHTIMRNNFYIFSDCPKEWKHEMRLKDGQESIVCDAWFKQEGHFHILEVDSTQTMKENKGKALIYHSMYQRGVIKKTLGYFPVVIWLTTSEMRREQLKELCKDFPSIVYTSQDIN